MSNFPCAVSIPCSDPNLPLANFSAEGPDPLLFVALAFPETGNPSNPLGKDPTGQDPTPPPTYVQAGCLGTCYSSTSDLASACAAAQAFVCGQNAAGNPNIFYNATQTASWTCPDGTLFTWTVPAGAVVASSQSLANEIAYAIAYERAAANHICLGDIATEACPNVEYNQIMRPDWGKPPFDFILTSGQLPPGIDLVQPDTDTGQLIGTPVTPGDYTFTINVEDDNNASISRTYTIHVLGITNIGSLPMPAVGVAYSEQLTATGGTAPFTYEAVLGGLPTGLSLSPDGLISGTPTVHYQNGTGAFNVVFAVTDANGNTCAQPWSGTVTEPPGPNWGSLSWSAFTLNQSLPGNTASGSGSNNTASASLNKDNGGFFPSFQGLASVNYNGQNFTIKVAITVVNSTGGPITGVYVSFNGGTYQAVEELTYPSNGVYSGTLASNAFYTPNTPLTLSVKFTGQVNGSGTPGSINPSIVIFNT